MGVIAMSRVRTWMPGLAAASVLTLAGAAQAAGPEVVQGPGVMPECFAPFSDTTKYFKFEKKDPPYRIALANFDLRNGMEILDYADIVKLDVQRHPQEQLAGLVQRLRRSRVQLVAEGVESAQDLARCLELGFDLLQGNFLAHPETFAGRTAPTRSLQRAKGSAAVP